MKVKCIDIGGWSRSLTLGKTYDVISEGVFDDYQIINDKGEEWHFFKKYFKPLSEIRNDKINKLLE